MINAGFTKDELKSLISCIRMVRVYTEIHNLEENLLDKLESIVEHLNSIDLTFGGTK